MAAEDVPLKYQGLIHRVKNSRSKSKADAIKAFCLECVGFKYKRVTNCTSLTCALFSVRPYQLNGDTGPSSSIGKSKGDSQFKKLHTHGEPESGRDFPKDSEGQLDTSALDLVWKGENYTLNRILVLGESWYGDYADNTDKGYVKMYLDGRQTDRMYTRMANACHCRLRRADFWNQIIFTNFVQKVGETRKDRPTQTHYKEAKPRLADLLHHYKPHGVWVLGKGQAEHSVPVIEQAGIPCEVTPHPTSFGLTNAALGASWDALLRKASTPSGVHMVYVTDR